MAAQKCSSMLRGLAKACPSVVGPSLHRTRVLKGIMEDNPLKLLNGAWPCPDNVPTTLLTQTPIQAQPSQALISKEIVRAPPVHIPTPKHPTTTTPTLMRGRKVRPPLHTQGPLMSSQEAISYQIPGENPGNYTAPIYTAHIYGYQQHPADNQPGVAAVEQPPANVGSTSSCDPMGSQEAVAVKLPGET